MNSLFAPERTWRTMATASRTWVRGRSKARPFQLSMIAWLEDPRPRMKRSPES